MSPRHTLLAALTAAVVLTTSCANETTERGSGTAPASTTVTLPDVSPDNTSSDQTIPATAAPTTTSPAAPPTTVRPAPRSTTAPTTTSLPPKPAPAPACTVSNWLREGDIGPDVTCLETALRHDNPRTLHHANDRYTSTTARAVRRYQTRNQLTVDGIAGPQTLGSLGIWAAPPEPIQPSATPWTVTIPAIGMSRPVYMGGQNTIDGGHATFYNDPNDTWPSSVYPGQTGTVWLAGHRTSHGSPFLRIPELAAGDTITFTSSEGAWTYRLVSGGIVPGYVDNHVVFGTDPGAKRLFLQTSWPNNQRVTYVGILDHTGPPPS
jgi:sortase (surface protein transpeptidase)